MVKSDLFALGSTLYEIMTGRSPYEETPSDEVERLYEAQQFPDVTSIPCGELIRRCWRGEANSAHEIEKAIKTSSHRGAD